MIKCHNWAPITHGCITVKGNKFPMWLARYLHKTPRRSLECTQDAWQIFQYVQQIWGCAWDGQQTLSLCWGHLAGSTTWNLSDMPGSSFHTQFQFPQQGCGPSQVPTDVAVWEISFLPITQHPKPLWQHSMPSNAFKRMPAHGNPSQKSLSGFTSQIIYTYYLPYIIDFFVVHLNAHI